MKYYVYRISKYSGRKEYKKTKTLETYVGEALKGTCWKFSKEGAKKIVVRNNEHFRGWHYEFGMEEAEEGARR